MKNTLWTPEAMPVAMPLPPDPENGAQATTPDPIYERMSKFPVLDAAYYLWKAKRQLDTAEGCAVFAKIEPAPDVSEPGVLRGLVASTVDKLQRERQSADEGPTLRRLLISHPNTTQVAAKEAIRKAVNLEDAGQAALISLGFELKNVSRAIETARVSNPGFSEEVYWSLWHELSYAACW